jgi:hypothetical protein
VSEADVRARRYRDGRAVSETLFRLLTGAGLIPDEFDLFVSYAHKDDEGGWVAGLVQAIREEHANFTTVPLRVFYDRADIADLPHQDTRLVRNWLAANDPDFRDAGA